MRLGYEVAVATRVTGHADAIMSEGIRVIPVNIERSGLGPVAIGRQIRQLTRLMRRERPTLVHCIALRSIVVGGFAARFAGVPALVLAVTGLGHLWVSRTFGIAAARATIRWLIRRLRRPGTVFLFENRDDPETLGIEPSRARIVFIPGAGVDQDEFPVQPEPDSPPFRVVIAARMLWAKGIGTAVEAVRQLRQAGVAIALDLWGAPDPDNPASIPEEQLEAWSDEPGITWHGTTADIPGIWTSAHIALLPSHYREGLPRSLIEAMASGRPVVTTDVPGCRELVRDGVEGFVVAKEDPAALATVLEFLVNDPELRQDMGEAARRRFELGYTSAIVGERIEQVYRELVPGN